VCKFTSPPRGSASLSSSFHAVSPGTAEWTLWKTFEDFQALDTDMRAMRTSSFARMMVPVAFAPEHKVRVFFHKDQTGSFLEKRRKELDYYMQRILMLPDVGDFCGGSGSSVLAEFLHAGLHVTCHANLTGDGSQSLSPVSMASTSTVNSVSRGLRQLHVDLRRAYSPPSISGSVADKYDDEHEPRSRKLLKQEIEQALLARGEHELRVFKKRASAFRKENDAQCGAQDFVAFVNTQYDRAFAAWLVLRFARSLRCDEQRAALLAASGLRDDEDPHARHTQTGTFVLDMGEWIGSWRLTETLVDTDKMRRNSMDKSPVSMPPARKRSKKEVLARVEKLAGGDADRVTAFKRAARDLGNNHMTTDDFVAFLNETFGDRDAQRILKLVVEVVPARLQHELSEAVRS
jgi:hypothetical protein